MECVVYFLIIFGGVRCFFFNYCWWSALFLLQLLLMECDVSSLIIVGGVRWFFFNYCCGSALFLL